MIFETKKGQFINLEEIACAEKLNARNFFENGREKIEYDFVMTLKNGYKLRLSSESYAVDIEYISNLLRGGPTK